MRSPIPSKLATIVPISIFGPFQPLWGFHQIEEDELGYFVWTRKRFRVRKPPAVPFVELNLCYYGEKGRLLVQGVDRDQRIEIGLYKGWGTYCLDLHCLGGPELEFEVDPLIHVPGDSRELGVMIRSFGLLRNQEQYEFARMKMSNRRMNTQEFCEGKPLLLSYPPQLRIDLETRCNLRPRCTYCHWNETKSLEEESPLRSTLDTISRLDEFLTYAEQIVDCGYGEPLLNPDLSKILDELKARRIRFEMTSNGVLLAPDIRKVLLGIQLTLYVSIDSATEPGYRRYRHASLDKILDNLRDLCIEKKRYGGLPRVIVSFITMSSNVGEFEQFLERMVATGVDAIKLRSLFCDPGFEIINGSASSQRFNYRDELLDMDTLTKFLEKARALADSAGIALVCEHDFGGDLEHANVPLCREPWETIYVLRRGIMPCCFSKSPLFTWGELRDKTLAQFLKEAWNSPVIQEIRMALARHQLHERCAEAKSCPIVKKWFMRQAK
ncbi:MAG: radical SAM/SPASM domain-containing protein [Desulfomonilaceae bacterium]